MAYDYNGNVLNTQPTGGASGFEYQVGNPLEEIGKFFEFVLGGGLMESLTGGTDWQEHVPQVQQVNPFTEDFQKRLQATTSDFTPSGFDASFLDALKQASMALPFAQARGKEAAQAMAPSGQQTADLASAAGQGQAASMYESLGGAESGAAKAALAAGAITPQLQFQAGQNQLAQSVQNQVLQNLMGQQLGMGQIASEQAGQERDIFSKLMNLQAMMSAPEFVGSSMYGSEQGGALGPLVMLASLFV